MTGGEAVRPYGFHMPVEVVFGPGSLRQLERARNVGRRPAVVCGARSARANGSLDTVLGLFPDALVLDGVPENPDIDFCDDRARQCREAGVDLVIGLGGGSALDAAKAIALIAVNRGGCRDYLDDSSPCAPALPIVAIPTTAGTGSEVTQYSVLTDTRLGQKKTLRHLSLFPRLALLDPDLTRNLPREVAVATALDALSQALEGMASRRATEPGDVLALEVCREVRWALPALVNQPDNEAARSALLHAAMLSGVVIAQSGTTLAHGLGYYYTLEHGIAHGAANALLLPPLFAWNARHVPDRVALLAGALGCPAAPEPEAAAGAIIKALNDLYTEIGFPVAARDHGIPEACGARWAAAIIREPYRFKNQVGDFQETDLARILAQAWRGEV